MLEPHIVKSFDGHLQKLHSLILQMGDLVLGQIDASLTALQDDDLAAVETANGALSALSALNHAVNEQVIRVLALRSPVADDLLVVTTALKISADLEQSGSYAAGNARRVAELKDLPHLAVTSGIVAMGRLAQRQIRDVLEAYRCGDSQKAATIWYEDWRLDEQYSGLFRQTLTYMMEEPATITPASHLLFIAKNIERIGDHGTNIAEMVYFLVTGTELEGDRRKGDTSITITE